MYEKLGIKGVNKTVYPKEDSPYDLVKELLTNYANKYIIVDNNGSILVENPLRMPYPQADVIDNVKSAQTVVEYLNRGAKGPHSSKYSAVKITKASLAKVLKLQKAQEEKPVMRRDLLFRGDASGSMRHEDSGRGLGDMLTSIIAIGSLIMGVGLVSSNVTGNVIGNSTISDINVMGFSFLALGLIFGYLWVSGKGKK